MELEKILNGEEQMADKPPRYTVRDANYILGPHPPINWVIEKLIHEGSVSIFFGEPGSKKTWALLSMAVGVALGKPWLGFNTVHKKVLIIDEEAGEEWISKRLAAAIRGELGSESTPIEFVSLAGFKVDDKNDAAEIEALILDRQAGLVIIDALTDVMCGDENSKQDTQPIFTALKKIAAHTNAAIVLIHHSNRAGGYRGSSAIKGAIDLLVKIESEEKSDWIFFKSEKTRNIEAIDFTAVAKWTDDQFYLEIAEQTTKEKPLTKSQKYVMRYLQEHGPSAIPDIMAGADRCSPNAARQAVYALVELEKVYRTNPGAGAGGRGNVAIYDRVNEPGDEGGNDEE